MQMYTKSDAQYKAPLKLIAKYYKPHKGLFMADIIAALGIALCDLFYPTVTRNIINVFIPQKQWNSFVNWIIILFGVFVLKAGLNYFVTRWGHIMGARMQADMRKDLFKHMQTLPFSYFDENRTGSLMSRIINDLAEITELTHHGPEDIFISLVSFIGAFIVLAKINIELTLIVFALLPFVLLFGFFMRTSMKNAFKKRRFETALISSEIENSISGIRVAKAFANSEQEQRKFEHRANEFFKSSAGAYTVMASYFTGMTFLTDAMTLTALVASGIYVFHGKINIGDFTAFILYVGNFVQPVRRFNQFIEVFQDGMTGFSRFCEVLNTKSEYNPLPEKTKKLKKIKGDIVFDNVSFCYGESASEVLSNVDIHIKAGQTAAIVGPSGGGKTTLCQLIPRFYRPQSGKILLDGADINSIDLVQLRGAVGIVQQDVFIFAGTIYDNIAYGDVEADKESVIQAAKDANLHDFILTLEDGYDQDIGERGAKLSGGQKQRIAIARVFLKNPPILILDEATSALDNITEQIIQTEFDRLAKNRTTLVVAHRLSTVKNADVIFVLTEQGVEESGSHEELLKIGNGIYRGLYETQFFVKK